MGALVRTRPGPAAPASHSPPDQPRTCRLLISSSASWPSGSLPSCAPRRHPPPTSPPSRHRAAQPPAPAHRNQSNPAPLTTRVPHRWIQAEQAPSVRGALHWRPRNSDDQSDLGRRQFLGVWRSGSACRLQRQPRSQFPSGGDRQEQTFAQVSMEYSPSSKWQRMVSSGTGWTEIRMSTRSGTGQFDRRFSGPCHHKPWLRTR
jgi:hypothetical protein